MLEAVQLRLTWAVPWFLGVPAALRLAGAGGGSVGVAETSADGALSLGITGVMLVLAFTAVTV